VGIPYTAAYRALFQRAGAKAGETVLIHGATGGVGVATLQWARAAGMKVIATGGTDQGVDLAAAHGKFTLFDLYPLFFNANRGRYSKDLPGKFSGPVLFLPWMLIDNECRYCVDRTRMG
jgi:NADPH:quinone reductase-like Zn-dependent oxidoreductase